MANSFMQEAQRMWREHSTERNHPTGAVVVTAGVVIGGSGNQAAIKNKTLQAWHKRGLCIRRMFKIPSGQKYWLCPGCAKHHHHAEQLAIRDAQKRGSDTTGADVYLYGHWWCCKPCWDAMIGAGIKDVYLVEGATEQFKR